MVVVAILGRQRKRAVEGCAGLKLDGFSALSAVQSRLQITAGVDVDDSAGRGCIRHGGGNRHQGQLRRTIVTTAGHGW